MKPIYKSIYDFNEFFSNLRITIFDLEYDEAIMNTLKDGFHQQLVPDYYPPEYSAPGVYILMNDLYAAYYDFQVDNMEFAIHFKKMQAYILQEIEKNIRNSTSNKELEKYLTELKTILKECESKIIEERTKTNSGNKCNYRFKNSSIKKINIAGDTETEAQEYLSNLFYWIKCKTREFITNANITIINARREVNFAAKMNSFKLFKQLYSSNILRVFSELRDRKFIDFKTDPRQFEAIFKNTPVEKPVKWISGSGDQKTHGTGDLKTFIQQMIARKVIENPERKIWDITKTCFVKEDGSLFDNSEIRGSKQTKRAEEVKSIVNKFLN